MIFGFLTCIDGSEDFDQSEILVAVEFTNFVTNWEESRKGKILEPPASDDTVKKSAVFTRQGLLYRIWCLFSMFPDDENTPWSAE